MRHRVKKGLLFGLLTGWLLGMLWWASWCVYCSFRPHVYWRGDVAHELPNTALSLLPWAPLTAIPWAVVGGAIGTLIGAFGGKRDIAASLLGAVGGVAVTLFGSHNLVIPTEVFVGALLGFSVGRALFALPAVPSEKPR